MVKSYFKMLIVLFCYRWNVKVTQIVCENPTVLGGVGLGVGGVGLGKATNTINGIIPRYYLVSKVFTFLSC